jgi:hypothetical protein
MFNEYYKNICKTIYSGRNYGHEIITRNIIRQKNANYFSGLIYIVDGHNEHYKQKYIKHPWRSIYYKLLR